MIFQLIIVTVLMVITSYAFLQKKSAPVVSISVILLSIFGLIFAVAPNLANKIAEMVGIGRGADLITYCFILTTFIAIFNLHLRFRKNEERLTKIVRAMAMLTALKPVVKNNSDDKFNR